MRPDGIIDVACLVLMDSGGRLFVARRPQAKSLGNLWEFPGGKIDPGESVEVALRRELVEELEMQVGPLEAMEPVDHRYDFGAIRLWPMLARCDEGQRPEYRLHEHTAVRWVDALEAESLDWAPADRPVLHDLGFLNRA